MSKHLGMMKGFKEPVNGSKRFMFTGLFNHLIPHKAGTISIPILQMRLCL